MKYTIAYSKKKGQADREGKVAVKESNISNYG